ncbi:S1 family peptidase [Streptomyces sp. W16]|uniref:S1 family peptidase n=1 Tax=Streptomyces sp. W16 TaxID=3076631 RepID=UPI00295ADFC1|nr:S1 family peptidase [Streptomyces sp. W16]MDV9173239.1 S1 family peptidase [Streptomyces sp. W16]
MRHARRRVVRRVTRLTAVGGLLLGGAMVTQAAMASDSPGRSAATLSAPQTPADKGSALVAKLGSARTAGSWVDSGGRTVVAVTDKTTAAEVTKAGAEAKVVRYSMNELKSAATTLSSAPKVPGTAWAMDYRNNKVIVEGDSSVSATAWAAMTKVATGIGASVEMQRTQGKFTTRINGAQPILSTGGRCSAGYNVTNGQTDFILTAGHCGPVGSIWFADNQGDQQLGKTVSDNFPGSDFSLVQYASGSAGEGADVVAIGNGSGVTITGLADAAVGEKVFRSGSTSGLHDGEVTALDATVNYPEGTVTGLIQTTVCAEPGDSGGPLFSNGIALGVTSGGSGDCKAGGTTFFQPLTKALAALNVKLLVAPKTAASPAPSASAAGSAAAGGSVTPGTSAPATNTTAGTTTLASRLTDPKNVGPGLLVIAGSLIALVATRWIRAEQDRKAFQRHYSAMWG